MMEFRGWLFVGLMSTLLAVYLWATGCSVNGAPAPISSLTKSTKLANKTVQGAYSVVPQCCQNFTFALLPKGIYVGHMGHFDNSANQDWSGTWKLDPVKPVVYITEWAEGAEWYGDERFASRWFISIKRDKTGRIIREVHICQCRQNKQN